MNNLRLDGDDDTVLYMGTDKEEYVYHDPPEDVIDYLHDKLYDYLDDLADILSTTTKPYLFMHKLKKYKTFHAYPELKTRGRGLYQMAMERNTEVNWERFESVRHDCHMRHDHYKSLIRRNIVCLLASIISWLICVPG